MFDKEKNGTINVSEFQALYNYINAWLGVFRGFDHDNSGSIQENELNAALTQMGYRLSPEFINFLIKKSDFKGHKSITVDQFIVLCVQIQRFTGNLFFIILRNKNETLSTCLLNYIICMYMSCCRSI